MENPSLTLMFFYKQIAPQIQEECRNSKECAPALHHFQACSDKVLAGKGWQGGECDCFRTLALEGDISDGCDHQALLRHGSDRAPVDSL